MRLRSDFVDNLDSLASLLPAELQREKVPGMSISLICKGDLLYTNSFGVKDEFGTPMTQDTLFESASLTKTLFGVLALRLTEEGLLELDMPIMEQFDVQPWSEDPRFLHITPRQCLCHSCGLPNWQAQPMEMLFDPGSSYSYSGEGYFLLQRLLEQRCGAALNVLLHRYFLDPLQMQPSTALWTPQVGYAFSAGFGADGTVVKRRNSRRTAGNAPEPNAAWSLYSNALQMAKFIQYMIRAHGGLGEQLFSQLSAPQNQATPEIPWGLGWGLCKKDPSVLWHWGDNDGFKSLSLWDRETGDGLCVYTNSDNGAALWSRLGRLLTDGVFFDDIDAFVRTAE